MEPKLDAENHRKIFKLDVHSERPFKGAGTNRDRFFDHPELSTHALHELATLESSQPKEQRSKK
jgi:hypothetical protein